MKIVRKHGATIIATRCAPRDFCLNLFGLLFVRDPSWISPAIVNHERIHDAQQRELLFLLFYLLYVLEWHVRVILYRNLSKAYYDISFEREAYANGSNPAYLSTRRHFAWLRYIRR